MMERDELKEIISSVPSGEGALIRILEEIQERERYLPREALIEVARHLGISPARVYGVASFYNAFSFEPKGRHTVQVCQGTACHVRGAGGIIEEAERLLGTTRGGTSPDGEFTLEVVNCVGACALGPVVITDGRYHGHVGVSSVGEIIEGCRCAREAGENPLLADPPGTNRDAWTGERSASMEDFSAFAERLREAASSSASSRRILVCGGTGCRAYDSIETASAIADELSKRGLSDEIELVTTGCPGFCEAGPLVLVLPEETLYSKVKASDASEIVGSVLSGEPVERLLYLEPRAKERIREESGIPFYARQARALLSNSGRIDPRSLGDYIARGGYGSLVRALSMDPEEIIEEMKRSGLRGRGGAGFPTGVKWEATRRAEGSPKYLVCNADEGDPGSFQDRAILESDPHGVIEGMIIGARAIGAQRGFIYCRAEYPLAIKHLGIAIASARAAGLLGEKILGTDFSFDIEIVRGAGAFVCGEETALLESIEGNRGHPRPKPPFPANSGLHARPTNINNVKSWRAVPLILEGEDSSFIRHGTEKTRGTMVFSLVGKVSSTGLVEVPMGITIRELVEGIGGGSPDGKRIKAVQMGGPSGGCIPERLFDTRIEYETIQELGAIVGSGGIIVLDESVCMVDVARYFTSFTKFESCGKCVPCRVGTRHLLEILERITRGEGREEDIALLEEISDGMKTGSLCGLGKTAPNPVLTTLRYFREEYDAHIREGACEARACKALVTYTIIGERCTACGLCRRACPAGAVIGEKKVVHRIDEERCVKCGACFAACPERFSAVEILTGARRSAFLAGESSDTGTGS